MPRSGQTQDIMDTSFCFNYHYCLKKYVTRSSSATLAAKGLVDVALRGDCKESITNRREILQTRGCLLTLKPRAGIT